MTEPSDKTRSISRREFTSLSAGAIAAIMLGPDAACAQSGFGDGRVAARPRANVKTTATGETRLGFGEKGYMPGVTLPVDRDGFLHMPAKAVDGPVPLLVLFHGASSSADIQYRRFGTIPDETGVAVLALDSRGATWDGIRGGRYSVDVAFLNRALEKTFREVNVDKTRLVIGGFSDGATYALALGIINGDLFSRIVAWSPGFLIDVGTPHGKPNVFISHGTNDEILPIDRCSRVIVPELRRRGYDVTFREFEGPHAAPPEIAREGFAFAGAVKK